MSKSLRLAIIIVISFCFFTPAETLPAKDEETVSRAEDRKDSDALYFQRIKQHRAALGIRNLEPHSVVLVNRGIKAYDEHREEEAKAYFNNARELSPDLPLPYLYLSRAYFSLSGAGIFTASDYLADAWEAFGRNFSWSFRAYGMLFISLLFAFYISFIVFSASLIFSKFNLYIHDITEDRRKIFLLLIPAALAFLGPVFGVAGFIVPFWVYLKARERAVFYSCLIIVILMLVMLPFLSSFPGAFQDKALQDVIRINNGIYTGESTGTFGGESSFEYSFTYAIEQKRKGNYDKAISLNNGLLNHGEDAKIYNNIANCFVGLGNYDMAFKYYTKASESAKIASAYYNMSQLYRELFNFDEAEKYYDMAVAIDAGKVALYSALKGAPVNSLVVDETLSNEAMRDLVLKKYPYYKSSKILKRMLSFINRELSIALLLLLIIALFVFRKKFSYGAYRCRRCGKIFCGTCEKRISHEDICLACFKTLVKVSGMGSRDRIERILEIQHYREEAMKRLKILTLISPGSGHIYYGWPVYGFLLLISVTFFLSSALLWFYFPVPASMNQVANYIMWVSTAGFIAVYYFAAENVFRRIPKKWL